MLLHAAEHYGVQAGRGTLASDASWPEARRRRRGCGMWSFSTQADLDVRHARLRHHSTAFRARGTRQLAVYFRRFASSSCPDGPLLTRHQPPAPRFPARTADGPVAFRPAHLHRPLCSPTASLHASSASSPPSIARALCSHMETLREHYASRCGVGPKPRCNWDACVAYVRRSRRAPHLAPLHGRVGSGSSKRTAPRLSPQVLATKTDQRPSVSRSPPLE